MRYMNIFSKMPMSVVMIYFLILVTAGAFVGIINNVMFPATTYANNIGLDGFCDDDDADPQQEAESGDGAEGGGCLLSNWVQIPEESRPTRDEFLNQAKDCQKNNAGNFSGIDGGACMNALRSCYELVLDKSKCKDTSDGGLVSRIGDECGSIVGSGGDMNPGDDCNPMSEANASTLDADEAAYKAKMKTCEQKPVGKERNDCYDVFNKAVATCAARAGLGTKNGNSRDGFDGAPLLGLETNDGGYNSMDLNRQQYGECLDTETRKNITDPAMCSDVGGIYLDQQYKDPNVANGGNVVEKGCKKDIREAANPAACEAAGKQTKGGTKWVKIDDKDNPNHWECQYVDPNEEPKPPVNEEADAEGVDGTKDNSVKEQCGQARTNLIGCGSETGATALNNVLKIIISVLTVLVGIAGVGGLAWASILYAKATDNQSNVSEARDLIQNIVIGLFLYVFLLAIVNFLVPGGLF